MWNYLKLTNYQPSIKVIVVASQKKNIFLLKIIGLFEIIKNWWQDI